MSVSFKCLRIGDKYTRPELAEKWGYKSYHAIGRGIVTPSNSSKIILFITEEKQAQQIQYKDELIGDKLYMEGEQGHSNDPRLVNASKRGDSIHLFHRKRHHSPFIYYGKLELEDYQLKAKNPSSFVFKLKDL